VFCWGVKDWSGPEESSNSFCLPGLGSAKEIAMNRFWAFIVLLCAASLTLACGSGSNRQLQSITISSVVSSEQIQFTATGTFSAAPTTVSPLPVDWGLGLFAPPPPGNLQYALTTQPFVFDCLGLGPFVPVDAFAPSDPNAPTTGSWPFAKMVTASTTIPCP
jgi:hypothetical protein